MSFSDGAISTESQDLLDRGRAVAALEGLLRRAPLEGSLVVGIYGGWGTGKTSVMRMLERKLEQAPGDASHQRITLWFDAWKYARQEQSLWRALLLQVIRCLGARTDALVVDDSQRAMVRDKLQTLEESLYRSLSLTESGDLRVHWGAALPLAADLAIRWLTTGVPAASGQEPPGPFSRFVNLLKGEDAKAAMTLIDREQRERYVAQVTSMEQFRDTLETCLALFGIAGAPAETQTGTSPDDADGTGRRLFLFVDDLDRCLPEDAVAALEAIKLFLDLPGCVFVLGMDRHVVEQGIAVRYRDFKIEAGAPAFDPRAYLDKIIQIPFNLPPLETIQVGTFLDGLIGGGRVHPDLAQCRDLIEIAVPQNPRMLKRVINVLELLLSLDGVPAGTDTPRARYIAKVALLQTCFDEAYRAIVGGEFTLDGFEKIARGHDAGTERSRHLLADPTLGALMQAEPWFSALASPAERRRLLTMAQVTASDP